MRFRSLQIHAIAVTFVGAAVLPLLATPASAQVAGACQVTAPQAQPKKKGLGLGKLMSGARSAGLVGSVMGAMRGDGNLGSDLAGTARVAAADAAQKAAECAGRSKSGAPDSLASPVEQPRAMRQSAPERRERERLSYPSEITKPADFAAMNAAFTEFGKDKCMACEGGFAFDSWPVFPRDAYSGKYNGDAQRMGSWPVGHVHRWKGNVSTGTLTVVAEETVEGFRCRRLAYRLTKGKVVAERPGLLCWGRANPFAGKESWNEVY